MLPAPPNWTEVPLQFAWIMPPRSGPSGTITLPVPARVMQGPVLFSATHAKGLLAGSAPATLRARTELSVDCAGTRLVGTSWTMVTSMYFVLFACGPVRGGQS